MPGTVEIERHPVQRLDQTLNLWEQRCFLLNSQARVERATGAEETISNGGAVRHYSELRGHILRSYRPQEFDGEKFFPPNQFVGSQLGGLSSYPYNLYQWNRFSRRVFHLSEDIQTQLENTSLEGIRWSDVKFPLDAYGMELETPITHREEVNCDFILVNRFKDGSKKGMMITMFPTALDNVTFLSKRERQRIEDDITKRRWRQLRDKFLDIQNNLAGNLFFTSFHFDEITSDALVNDTDAILKHLEESFGRKLPEDDARKLYWRSATQLIVGFSLYLQQLPSGSTHRSEWLKLPGTPDPTVITSESEVCYITSTHPLVKSRIRDLHQAGRGGYEMRWHWRRGYWSRRPGEGHIPWAPKVVWHPPQDIRADRKPAGTDSIPSGSQSQVNS